MNAIMIKVNIQDAKTHFSKYVDRAMEGEVIVVCRYNRPVVEVRAITTAPAAPRVAGLLKGQVSWTPDAFAPMTDAEAADFDKAPVFPAKAP
jgi:antitoxin (DNA-binding transcriptional repressor) of toxin-antitoxin stability system